MMYEEKVLKLRLLKTNEIIEYKVYFIPKNNKNNCFIYAWLLDNLDGTFTPKYIGQTTRGKYRWKQERSDRCKQDNIVLYNLIHKYGSRSFPCIIEFIDDKANLDSREYFYYNLFNTSTAYNGANIKIPMYNRKEIPELEKNIIKLLKDKKLYSEIRRLYPSYASNKIININLGKTWFDPKLSYPLNPFPYENLRLAKIAGEKSFIGFYDKNTGKLIKIFNSTSEASNITGYSRNTIQKMILENYGVFRYSLIENELPNKITIINKSIEVDYIIAQYNLNGNLLNIFNSVRSAAQFVNGNRYNILECIKGNSFQSKEFIWKKFSNILIENIPTKIEIKAMPKTGKFGGKEIYQYDLDYNLILKHRNVHEAAKAIGNANCYSALARGAKSNGKAIRYNYRWSYIPLNK